MLSDLKTVKGCFGSHYSTVQYRGLWITPKFGDLHAVYGKFGAIHGNYRSLHGKYEAFRWKARGAYMESSGAELLTWKVRGALNGISGA